VPSDRYRTIATTALAPAIWGTTYLATTQLIPAGRPLLAAVLRALPAGLVLVAVTRRRPEGIWWWRAVALGALNIGAFFALLFVAAYRLPGGVAATIVSLQPLLVVGLSSRLLGERASPRILLVAAAGVLGVGLLVLRSGATLDGVGVVAALGAAGVMAVGVVLSKRWPSPAPLLATTGWQLVAGGLLALPFALAVEGPPPASLSAANLAGYAYLTFIGAAVAYALWFRGIRALDPTNVTFLALLSPLVAAALGWILLGQHLAPLQIVGGLIVLGSVVVAQVQRTPTRPIAQPGQAPGVARSYNPGGHDMSTTTTPLSGTYDADPIHSSFGFSVHLQGVSVFRGMLTEAEAKLLDGRLEGTAKVESISITTPQQFRAHVLSGEFFDAENHPEVKFRSTTLDVEADGTTRVTGDLTIKGITRPVQATGRWTRPAADAFGNARAHLELEAVVDRTEWGMNWNMALPSGGDALANDVTLTVELSLVEQA
jgi:probable blue pigment (indigoidine) exporter